MTTLSDHDRTILIKNERNMTDQELLNALFRSVDSEYGLMWDAVALWDMEF